MNPSDAVPDGSPLVERKISAPAQLVQSTAQKPQEQKFYIPPDEEEPVKRERSHTPPPSKPDKVLASVPAKQSAMVSPLAKSSSDPNLLAAGGRNKHDAVSKCNSHEDENWYMPGIPRLVTVSNKLSLNTCSHRQIVLFLQIKVAHGYLSD